MNLEFVKEIDIERMEKIRDGFEWFGSVSSSGVENGCLDLGGEIGEILYRVPSSDSTIITSPNSSVSLLTNHLYFISLIIT